MWVVFRISDREIVGSTVDGGVELSKEEALADVVGGLEGQPDIGAFDAVQIKEGSRTPNLIRSVGSGRARLTDSGGGNLTVEDDSADSTLIRVTTNAQEFHPVDSVPLLAGDGESFLVVTLEEARAGGGEEALKAPLQAPLQAPARGKGKKARALMAPISGEEERRDDKVIWLRPSHGSIREDNDTTRQEIRFVTLVNGTARFRFYSEPAKRLASIQMLSANPNLIVGGLQVELV